MAARRRTVGGAIVVASLATAGILIAIPAGLRIVIALTVGFFLTLFALRSPRASLASLVVWFVTLGLARRLLLALAPSDAYGDPLLLAGAGTWVILAFLAVRRGALADRKPLTGAVLTLMVLLVASVVNPLQGGLAVGFGGALLVVVPMLAFFVGRSLVDDALLDRLLGLVAWLGLIVAVYGLFQTFVGFPPWDERWIAQQSNVSLNVGGVIRAFGSFSAASEYAGFLGLAIVAWVARARGLTRGSLGLIALGVLGSALWFESGRGAIVLTIIAIGAVLAARAGLTLWRSLLFGIAVLLVLPVIVGRLAPAEFSDKPAGGLSRHQVEGLSDPFGKGSTLPIHITSMITGLTMAISEPLGIGIGSVTISGEKYGGNVEQTEADPSNAAVAAGVPGLLAYLAVVLLGLPRVYRRAALQRDPISLAALGILIVTSLQWLNGGHYAVMFWPWLILGWSDARSSGAVTAEAATADATEVCV